MYFFLQKHAKCEDANLKRVREDLQNKVDLLRKQTDVSRFFCVITFLVYVNTSYSISNN